MSRNDMPVQGVPAVLYPTRVARAEGESDASFVARVKEWRAVSISVVDMPVDPNCKTSDGRYLTCCKFRCSGKNPFRDA